MEENQDTINPTPTLPPVAQLSQTPFPKKPPETLFAIVVGVVLFLIIVVGATGFYIFKSQSQSQIDCGTETINDFFPPPKTPQNERYPKLQCFVDATKTCKSAAITIKGELTITSFVFVPGVISGIDYYDIKKDQKNNCILHIRGGEYSRTFTDDVSENYKKSVLEMIKKYPNAEGTCVFPNYNDLSESFRKLGTKAYFPYHTPEDEWRLKAQCSGEYFNVMINNPQTPTPSSTISGSQTSPTPTCMIRPACLDATPRCMIREPAQGWCP